MKEPVRPGKGKADDIDKLVSRRIKTRRMIMGLSQQDLGKAVEVSIQQIQKYEKATNRISSGKLYTLANFLKVPVDYFYDQSDCNKVLNNSFAEDAVEYQADNEFKIDEKEIVALVKNFSEVKNSQARKKIIELVKTMK